MKLTTRNERNEYPNAREGIDKQLLDNLSLTEHLRWNAKMELLGFVPGPAKDFRKKTHPCIVDCNELIRNEKTRSTFIYDTGVVELSFRWWNSASGKPGNKPRQPDMNNPFNDIYL